MSRFYKHTRLGIEDTNTERWEQNVTSGSFLCLHEAREQHAALSYHGCTIGPYVVGKLGAFICPSRAIGPLSLEVLGTCLLIQINVNYVHVVSFLGILPSQGKIEESPHNPTWREIWGLFTSVVLSSWAGLIVQRWNISLALNRSAVDLEMYKDKALTCYEAIHVLYTVTRMGLPLAWELIPFIPQDFFYDASRPIN